MKINIIYPLTSNPNGGGNQFLRALRTEFIRKGMYSEMEEADIILFNSHQNVTPVIKARQKNLNAIFVHRIDGPIRMYNKMSDRRDDIVYALNNRIADATVFQSEYSKRANIELQCPRQQFETVILNSSDLNIFYPMPGKTKDFSNDKVRIIATSFSDNWKKGFKTYQWLDEHLDFDRYEMVFVGKSPCEFRNIKMLGVMNSFDLAEQLRQSDVFITASQNECCTNSLIEAICCGLPSLAINSGGNVEIIKTRNGGLLFDKAEEVPDKLDDIVKHYSDMRNALLVIGVDKVAAEYLTFFQNLIDEHEAGHLALKKIKWRDALYFRWIGR